MPVRLVFPGILFLILFLSALCTSLSLEIFFYVFFFHIFYAFFRKLVSQCFFWKKEYKSLKTPSKWWLGKLLWNKYEVWKKALHLKQFLSVWVVFINVSFFYYFIFFINVRKNFFQPRSQGRIYNFFCNTSSDMFHSSIIACS